MAQAKKPAPKAKPVTHVAWLRGVNVSGANRVPMPALCTMFADAGCRDVRSYIQSGNVLFNAAPAVARTVGKAVAQRLQRDLKLNVPVVIRTRAELEAVAKRNPFPTDGVDPRTLHVVFLADEPTPSAVAALDPNRSPPDEFKVIGKEIYLRTPNGTGKSKLSNAYFDSKLKTVSTGRNWRTVLTMLELAQ